MHNSDYNRQTISPAECVALILNSADENGKVTIPDWNVNSTYRIQAVIKKNGPIFSKICDKAKWLCDEIEQYSKTQSCRCTEFFDPFIPSIGEKEYSELIEKYSVGDAKVIISDGVMDADDIDAFNKLLAEFSQQACERVSGICAFEVIRFAQRVALTITLDAPDLIKNIEMCKLYEAVAFNMCAEQLQTVINDD